MLSIHQFDRRSHNSVVRTLRIDVIASHKMSTFNMVNVNEKQCNLLMVTPTLQSKAEDQKVCKKKNLSWLFGARPSGCQTVIPRGRFFCPHLPPMKDSYNLTHVILPRHSVDKIHVQKISLTMAWSLPKWQIRHYLQQNSILFNFLYVPISFDGQKHKCSQFWLWPMFQLTWPSDMHFKQNLDFDRQLYVLFLPPSKLNIHI